MKQVLAAMAIVAAFLVAASVAQANSYLQSSVYQTLSVSNSTAAMLTQTQLYAPGLENGASMQAVVHANKGYASAQNAQFVNVSQSKRNTNAQIVTTAAAVGEPGYKGAVFADAVTSSMSALKGVSVSTFNAATVQGKGDAISTAIVFLNLK